MAIVAQVAAVAQIPCLAREFPYAVGMAKKGKKKKKEKRRNWSKERNNKEGGEGT